METLEEPPLLSIPADPGTNHGFTRDERSACCGLNSSGLVDCQACLDGEVDRLSEFLDQTEEACALEIVSLLNEAGPHGIRKRDLLVSPGRIHNSPKFRCHLTFQGCVRAAGTVDVYDMVDKIISRRTPLFFWTGYLSIVLVSSAYLQTWSIVVSTSEGMVKPRRWTDIRGSQVPEVWEAGLRAVIGTIVSRPAITQVSVGERREPDENS